MRSVLHHSEQESGYSRLNDFAIELRDFGPRYNLGPGQTAPVIRFEDGKYAASNLLWGLIPWWAKNPKIAFQFVKARAESIATKPGFKEAFKSRCCAVPADGGKRLILGNRLA